MLVGITGPSGAGKGCVVALFAERGFEVIDADKIAREVVLPGEPVLKALAEAFGSDILLDDGSLDRRALAGKAFASARQTERLNHIMHAEIVRRMIARAAECAAAGKNCVFDAPLLIEAGLEGMCDTTIAVIAPLNERIKRLMGRDGLTEQEIRSRISRQHDDAYYTSRCEVVIVNDGDREALERKAAEVADSILARYGKTEF